MSAGQLRLFSLWKLLLGTWNTQRVLSAEGPYHKPLPEIWLFKDVLRLFLRRLKVKLHWESIRVMKTVAAKYAGYRTKRGKKIHVKCNRVSGFSFIRSQKENFFFLTFVILCRNKTFCENNRNISHQCETNCTSSERGNICASVMWWTMWWWRLSYGGYGEVTDSHVWSLRRVLGVLIADVSKNEPEIPEFTMVTLWDLQISCIKL
jgi:hypothetical protein